MLVQPITVYKYNCNYRPNNRISFCSAPLLFSDIDTLIKNNNIQGVKNIPDIYMVNKKYDTLLHVSARYNKPEISKYLLARNLNPNQKNLHGRTPFSIACEKGSPEHIAEFLINNPDVNTTDVMLNTPLHYARRNPEVVKLLLENGANPYLKNDAGQTPVVLALEYPESLKVYLETGVNPNLANSKNQTLLHSAIMKNNLEAAKLLKQYKADTNYIDEFGRSPIFYAQTSDALKFLMSNHAKTDIQDKNGQTPLHLNVINKNLSLTKYLLANNANPNIKDNKGLSPLGYAKTLKTMQLLLEKGANPDVITPKGSTLLHNLTITDNLQGVYLLLNSKANPNIPDAAGNIPLDYAKSQKIYTLLLGYGTDPNYRNYLKSALISKNDENVSNLLECGANPNTIDKKGNNSAFYINNSDELELLKKYKTNLDRINNYGYSPVLHFALTGKEDVVKLLVDAGVQKTVSNNGETIADCHKKYEKYHNWIKPASKNKQTTFTGCTQYTQYGSQDTRNTIRYKSTLTPDKINEIIINSKTTDEGLVEAYKQLNDDRLKLNSAVDSFFKVILRQYQFETRDDISNLMKKNPSGSKIPVVGIINQYSQTKFTDSFQNELKEDIGGLKIFYKNLVTYYYKNGISPVADNYIKLNEYITDGIKYVNYIQGETKTRKILLERLENNKQKVIETNNKCNKAITNLADKYDQKFQDVLEYQKKKQNRRTFKKSVNKLISLGLS